VLAAGPRRGEEDAGAVADVLVVDLQLQEPDRLEYGCGASAASGPFLRHMVAMVS
jgi:hypothetical protein